MGATTNNKNKLPKSIIDSASKCKVRECDEINKNVFQAYVDEGQNSYDVMLEVNDAMEVVSHQCDCGKKVAFCEHKTALYLYISKKTGEQKKNKNTKVDRIDQVLSDIDPESLKAWLKIQLKKNKDLALSFLHQFSRTASTVSPSDIKAATLKAVNAVINKRRRAEAVEAKKIVDLWSEIHEGIVKSYYSNPDDENKFLLFHAVVDAIDVTRSSVATGSKKIVKYLNDLLVNGSVAIGQIEVQEARQKATGFVMECLVDNGQVHTTWLSLINQVINKSNADQKKDLTLLLCEYYEKYKVSTLFNGNEYTKMLLHLLISEDLFETKFKIIKPIRYDNEHNVALIEELIAINQLDIAKQYCQQQIDKNTNAEYDLEYLELLKEIYTLQQDSENLTKVLMVLFPIKYDFNEYLSIMEHMEDAGERKKWRTKVLTSARNGANFYNRGQLFAFQLMDYEKDYKKMLTYVDSYTHYDVLATYAEKMILTDKYGFLRVIFNRDDSLTHMSEVPQNYAASIDTLMKLLKEYYSSFEIEGAIKTIRGHYSVFRTNLLVEMLKRSKV